VRAVHSLATLQGEAETAAPAYVREVFDELAETFEEKLVTHLEYRVPWLLVDALKKHEPSVFSEGGVASPASWRVADVGCGTGLCGRLLRPYVAHIAGVHPALA
jgi:predicted TPR repeat methyltransferase